MKRPSDALVGSALFPHQREVEACGRSRPDPVLLGDPGPARTPTRWHVGSSVRTAAGPEIWPFLEAP